MKIFNYMEEQEFEQLVFCQDRQSGLKALIAIHSTALGPALGGARMWHYDSEDDAVEDALRLARGMSYKAAVAGLPLGGGKSVIIGDPERDKNKALFRSFGAFIDRLQGWYITAEDVGTAPEDMDCIAEMTRWVMGTTGGAGDPSPWTARGVRQGMLASLQHLYGSTELAGRVVAVQGAGHVGSFLCRLLAEDGAKIVVSDINPAKSEKIAAELNATVVSPEEIIGVPCDIFSPCAMGEVINDDTIPRLRCSIVAGAANNVLKESRHGYDLAGQGIFYAPDYVINAGGLICVAGQLDASGTERVMQRINGIYDTCLEIFALAEKEGMPGFIAADRIAEQRIAEGAEQKKTG